MTTKAQKEATDRYIDKNDLVEIKFRVSKDKRNEYKNKILELGYSMNQFIIEAIEEKLNK